MEYYLPAHVIVGGWEKELPGVIGKFSCPLSVLIITSGNAMRNAGVLEKMASLLAEQDCGVSVFDQVVPNPSPEMVGTAEKAAGGADLIIGIGGGSVLDVAKMVASRLKRPSIGMPTTAGTGSEATPFAALYVSGKEKLSETPGYFTYALVDYKLCLTAPKPVVASSGLDALAQSMEAFWGVYSTPLTDVHAREAIRLAFENVEKAWQGDEKAMEMMSLAALQAALAFSQTKTSAPHSVAYPFTIFYGVSHGLACALTLPHFLVYNHGVSAEDCLHPKGPEFVRQRTEEIAGLLGARTVEDGRDKILALMERVGAPLKMKFDENVIVEHGFSPARVKNNPRSLSEAGLREILKHVQA